MNSASFAARRAAFRKLHESSCFMLPNPWDPGSARALQQLGFKALATTSSGFAWSRAHADNAMDVDAVLAHCRAIVAATDLPVNADFEDGHARDLKELADNVRRCVDTGVAGLSIEDSTGDAGQPLYELEEAVARMRAARAAIDASGQDVMLIGRAECFLVGHPDPLDESLKRLRVYAEAGADCLYAPGLRTREQIEAVVRAVAPKPVNVLVGYAAPFTQDDLATLGVRRISVGGALAGAAWGGFLRAARGLAEGRFDGFSDNATHAELNGLF
ncbi:isocitrate lyase/phosphoenolpyruvate mutase family protein [Rhodanobacter sp. 7MK24]|uniref:isocitrate lyase/PEP mutase family protein n=1 Tax=Rhodanobacter sp. 7MK24 TaxID=2775922 RepID=UPI0017812EB7|nr:isocitrate lyase/phosphoenolpyruvate mutase family protein [Rhodanobacter sp. 7MK24]MBD8881218.1 isocitrate lyase/phosphoenolpyruvate mutase family protein [Rhodanobacter sp. 7MK24]